MAVNNTAQPAGLITQLQTYFSKQLLERQIQLLQMEQFAEKVPYPTKSGGNKTIRFFRFDNPSISNTDSAVGYGYLTLRWVTAT